MKEVTKLKIYLRLLFVLNLVNALLYIVGVIDFIGKEYSRASAELIAGLIVSHETSAIIKYMKEKFQ